MILIILLDLLKKNQIILLDLKVLKQAALSLQQKYPKSSAIIFGLGQWKPWSQTGWEQLCV